MKPGTLAFHIKALRSAQNPAALKFGIISYVLKIKYFYSYSNSSIYKKRMKIRFPS